MKIRVRDGFQINHQGVHAGGDVFDAPDAKAKRWVEAGLAKAVSGSKNKAVQSSANKAQKPEKDDLSEFALGGGWYRIGDEKVQGEDAARKALNKMEND